MRHLLTIYNGTNRQDCPQDKRWHFRLFRARYLEWETRCIDDGFAQNVGHCAHVGGCTGTTVKVMNASHMVCVDCVSGTAGIVCEAGSI